jgi:hypothetical protein
MPAAVKAAPTTRARIWLGLVRTAGASERDGATSRIWVELAIGSSWVRFPPGWLVLNRSLAYPPRRGW